jgi:hypothetical protein
MPSFPVAGGPRAPKAGLAAEWNDPPLGGRTRATLAAKRPSEYKPSRREALQRSA